VQNYHQNIKQESNHFTTEQVQQLLNLLQGSFNHNVNQIHNHNGESFVQEPQIGKIYWILILVQPIMLLIKMNFVTLRLNTFMLDYQMFHMLLLIMLAPFNSQPTS